MKSAPAIVGGLVSEGMDVLKGGREHRAGPARYSGGMVWRRERLPAIRFFSGSSAASRSTALRSTWRRWGILVIILQAMGVITDAPAPVAEVAAAARAVSGM